MSKTSKLRRVRKERERLLAEADNLRRLLSNSQSNYESLARENAVSQSKFELIARTLHNLGEASYLRTIEEGVTTLEGMPERDSLNVYQSAGKPLLLGQYQAPLLSETTFTTVKKLCVTLEECSDKAGSLVRLYHGDRLEYFLDDSCRNSMPERELVMLVAESLVHAMRNHK